MWGKPEGFPALCEFVAYQTLPCLFLVIGKGPLFPGLPLTWKPAVISQNLSFVLSINGHMPSQVCVPQTDKEVEMETRRGLPRKSALCILQRVTLPPSPPPPQLLEMWC